MDYRVVCRFRGQISLAEAGVTCVPLLMALVYWEDDLNYFII